MGGVLLDWNPRHLYRKLIPDADEMERFLATVTTTAWHAAQDAGGDPVEATRRLKTEHPGSAGLIEAFYDRFDEMLDHPFPEMASLVVLWLLPLVSRAIGMGWSMPVTPVVLDGFLTLLVLRWRAMVATD